MTHSDLQIRLLKEVELPSIVPLVNKLNPKLSEEVLSERLQQMIPQGYECVGIFHGSRLIGISGIWIQTRFYCGKMIEPDNVFIEPEFRGQGIGKKLMQWIYALGRARGCVVSELNCYVANTAGQEFWKSEGFEVLGFHFQKLVQENVPA